MEETHLYHTQEQRILRVLACSLTFVVQGSTRPISVEGVINSNTSGITRGHTITGTGLKKWRPVAAYRNTRENVRRSYSPTTRAALAFPTSDAAVSPDGMAAAA